MLTILLTFTNSLFLLSHAIAPFAEKNHRGAPRQARALSLRYLLQRHADHKHLLNGDVDQWNGDAYDQDHQDTWRGQMSLKFPIPDAYPMVLEYRPTSLGHF